MILNTSFYPISIFHNISHSKVSFSYHQSHNTTLSLNKINLSFYAQKLQSAPVGEGSDNCYNIKKVFIFKILCYPCGFNSLGLNMGWNVCVYITYMSEK